MPDKCLVMTSPSFTTASRNLNGILIRNEFIQAVKNIVAFYKGGTFADMTVTSDNPHQEVDTSMDTSVGVAASSAGPVTFPTSIDNPFLDKDLRDKPKPDGVAICGSPGTGEH